MTSPATITKQLHKQSESLGLALFRTPIFRELDELIIDEDPEPIREFAQRCRVAVGRCSACRDWNQRRLANLAKQLRDPDADVVSAGLVLRAELFSLLCQHPQIQDRI